MPATSLLLISGRKMTSSFDEGSREFCEALRMFFMDEELGL